jgi:hypothetical protein
VETNAILRVQFADEKRAPYPPLIRLVSNLKSASVAPSAYAFKLRLVQYLQSIQQCVTEFMVSDTKQILAHNQSGFKPAAGTIRNGTPRKQQT